MSLKCADLGHLAASKEVHCNWVNRLEEEVRMDQEQQLGRSTGSRESGTKCAVCRYAESLLKDMTPRWMPRPLQFFAQGDRELEAGLPISPLMDRTKEGITRSQPGFFSIVALPLFQSLCNFFPGCTPMLTAVKDNYSL